MVLHLVSGFLGSGKTTAIHAAICILNEMGLSAGVVTNDQGKHLVDTHFFKSGGVPVAEITSGCFCCNYNQLTEAVSGLQKEDASMILFAESVGSCTDLMATVIKPLLKHQQEIQSLSFSTFVDAALLYSHLLGNRLSLHEDTAYIWHKQLEEADILIINKIDLIPSDEMQIFRSMADKALKGKRILFQDSLSKESVRKWIDALATYDIPRTKNSLVIDYARYGAGEANLAWLDQSLEILTRDGSAWRIASEILERFTQSICDHRLTIGHLKFILHHDGYAHKVSVTATTRDVIPSCPVALSPNRVLVVVNARIETSPITLRSVLSHVTDQVRTKYDAEIIEKDINFFNPGFPRPVHRIM